MAAIDRPQFAVHLDPTNLINSPAKFYDNAGLLRECFAKLGPHIRCCHAKDITLANELTVHLAEAIPGQGALDYRVLLTELDRLDPDTPILVEHLTTDGSTRRPSRTSAAWPAPSACRPDPLMRSRARSR